MEIKIETLMYGNKEKLNLLLGRNYSQKIQLDETDEMFSKLYNIAQNILEKRDSGVKIKARVDITLMQGDEPILIQGDKPAIIVEAYFSKSVFFREGNCIVHYIKTHSGDGVTIGYNYDLGYDALYGSSQRVKSKEFSDTIAAIYNK